jgi:hypothetical protein
MNEDGMSHTHLSVYLNDHLAGGTAALELLRHLERRHVGTPLARDASALYAEVAADHQELQTVMSRAGISPSIVRRAAAWLTEKAAELKTSVDDSSDGRLRLLETFEALSLGIEGKRLLWIGLARVADEVPALRGTDFSRLEQRAENQRRRVEEWRVEAARSALPAREDLPNPS